MKPNDDPFVPLAAPTLPEEEALGGLLRQPVSSLLPVPLAPAIGVLQGFDLLDRPLVGRLSAAPGQCVSARTTVALRRVMAGREVLVVFEEGVLDKPVIVGVLETNALQEAAPLAGLPGVQVAVDGDRCILEGEREVVLRCGEASITLTRAGKVLIRGRYILSRSTGSQKIQGASIELN